MDKRLKIGKEAILVNMGFIHKGYLSYDKATALFQKIKIEIVEGDSDGILWINKNLRHKYVFGDIDQAKEFVNKYLRAEILRKKKESLETCLLINYYEQIMLDND
tara:strand:- start:649 stop:963 length:315 start_codon:yes stop_codon:yes gene_type:complete